MKFCMTMYLDNPYWISCSPVKGQGHMGFCLFCVYDTAWTSWPGFTKCCTGMARGQYLALSKGWHSCYTFERKYTLQTVDSNTLLNQKMVLRSSQLGHVDFTFFNTFEGRSYRTETVKFLPGPHSQCKNRSRMPFRGSVNRKSWWLLFV